MEVSNKVRVHKEVIIYVNPEGVFYADADNNSNDWKKKTFHSEKLSSVIKAIDKYVGEEIKYGKVYADIQMHTNTIKILKVTKKIGERIFFDDGTDTSRSDRKNLFPFELIAKSEAFMDLRNYVDQLNDLNAEISALSQKRYPIYQLAHSKFRIIEHLKEKVSV